MLHHKAQQSLKIQDDQNWTPQQSNVSLQDREQILGVKVAACQSVKEIR